MIGLMEEDIEVADTMVEENTDPEENIVKIEKWKDIMNQSKTQSH